MDNWRTYPQHDGLPSPVFLVGHPRSGTTLTEQVLFALPNTVVSGEKPLLENVVTQLLNRAGGMDRVAFSGTHPVPTMPRWGLLFTALLVLTAGAYLLSRAQRPSTLAG